MDPRELAYEADRRVRLHAFTDEAKAHGYIMVAALLAPAKLASAQLILETEEGALRSDKALIFAQLRSGGDGNALQYAHMRAYEESLLAIPDAIAWSWAKGGHWRARVNEIVTDVRRV